MAIDEELLKTLEVPTLHLYEWERPSATYGRFIRPEEHLTDFALRELDLGRRPTGGGILFHTHDLCFSALLPATHPAYSSNTLETYALFNGAVARALKRLTDKTATLLAEGRESGPFCMAKPTIYDVLLDGKKVGGAAQRRTKRGVLHQGSIQLAKPPRDFLERSLKSADALHAIEEKSPLFSLDREPLRQFLIEEINQLFIIS